MNAIKTFLAAEDGAVTVDWVVLTAALVGLGLAVLAVVSDGVNSVSNATADDLAAIDPVTQARSTVQRTAAAP
ncbi:MAG: hypothetical protein AAFN09_08800 [Pseudomonadota bacterium]